MPTATRHFGLIATFAMFALLAGHTSFALHATSHDLLDSTECELCISYGNTTATTNAATEHGVLPAQDAPAGWKKHNEPTPEPVNLLRPRGPPSAN